MVFESLFTQFFSVGGILTLIINVLITTIAIIIADKLIAHEIEVKHSFLMAFIAYLIVPLAIGFLVAFFPALGIVGFILPLLIWVILGELLLKADVKQKAIVAVIAYIVNLFLLSYVSGFIIALVPF